MSTVTLESITADVLELVNRLAEDWDGEECVRLACAVARWG